MGVWENLVGKLGERYIKEVDVMQG